MKRLANWLDRIGISATLTESMSAGVGGGLDDFRGQMAAGYDVLFSQCACWSNDLVWIALVRRDAWWRIGIASRRNTWAYSRKTSKPLMISSFME